MTVYVVTYENQRQKVPWKGKILEEFLSELRKRFERWNGTLVQVFDTSLENWFDLNSEVFATMLRSIEPKIELRLISLTPTSLDPRVCASPSPPSSLPNPRPRAMPSTTMCRGFMDEPMEGGTVDKLPGIGPVSGERLRRAGFGRAEKVFGQFLTLERTETRYAEWLAHESNAQRWHLETSFNSLTDCPSAMSSTSQKHQNFVAEPMGEKEVFELAGIGPALGGRLVEAGFDQAYVVLGQLLVLRKDEELFKDWLHKTALANPKQQNDCYNCLMEWCDAFL